MFLQLYQLNRLTRIFLWLPLPVDEPTRLFRAEAFGDLDSLVDRHDIGDVFAEQDLVDSQAEDATVDRREERPLRHHPRRSFQAPGQAIHSASDGGAAWERDFARAAAGRPRTIRRIRLGEAGDGGS